jgi:hypothetical protein
MTVRERARDRYYRRTLKVNGKPLAADPGALKRAAIINAHDGHGYGLLLVWLRRVTGLGLPMICALVFHESGMRNVYGHDPVRNPIKSPPGGLLFVTRLNYAAYKRFRKAGLGMQGVGPFQLTWFEYQDQADALGGCHKPKYNGLVACQHMQALIKAHGEVRGVALYNGTGPAADAYSRAVRAERDTWRNRLN